MSTPVIKPWGQDIPVFVDVHCHVRHASINRGGFSSCHQHVDKINRFYVVSGYLQIALYKLESEGVSLQLSPEPYDVIDLKVGDSFDVPKGVWHRFYAKTAVELLEIYYQDAIRPHDIVRHDEGGLKIVNGIEHLEGRRS